MPQTSTLPAGPALTRGPALTATVVLRKVGLALLVGFVVGALTSFGQTLLGDTAFAGLSNAVSPWLVVAFVLGALAHDARLAAVLGLLACFAQVPGYYVVADLRGFGVSTSMVILWSVAGVLGGPLLGWAGHAWRTATGRLRGAGPALFVAAWAAEGVVTYLVYLGYVDDGVVFLSIAVLLAVLLGVVGRQARAMLTWLPLTLVLGGAGFVAFHTILA